MMGRAQSTSAVTLSKTATFREEVANFLFSCDKKLSSSPCDASPSLTSWIGDTARAVTLRSVATAGHIPMLSANESNSASVRADFICLACGTLLLPQHTATAYLRELAKSPNPTSLFEPSPTPDCKISLRSMKRGRSRRRRASRCRAKQLHNASLLMKRTGGTNNVQVRMTAIAQKDLLKVADSYRIGDGKSKHCIVIECNFCGAKRKRKGIEISVKNMRRRTEPTDATANCSKKTNKKKTQTNKERSVETQIRDNTDFISLVSFGDTQQGKKVEMNNDAPLLQIGKKKKKKQEPKNKNSDLMDFLSSLND